MAGKELGFLRIARMFKSQLQELCQKKRWGLPRYSAMSDGPDHNPRFKASVSIDGLSFHSPPSCNSFKQAQNEAAQIAFRHFTSPSPRPEGSEVPSNEHEGEGEALPGLYKNLLQELAQRRSIPLPVYATARTGLPHCTVFFSSVKVGAEKFHGEAGKSKKEAEMNAAKVAYAALKEPLAPGSAAGEGDREEVKEVVNLMSSEAPRSSAEGITSSSLVGSKRARSELVLNKVRVYGSVPDIEFARGITVMPFGDDRWVAVCLELPDQLT